jgi:hypothetical protein
MGGETNMRGYEAAIIETTGCKPEDAALIEDIMRNEIFHSTLDWQTPAQFWDGVRRAARVLDDNRELFEENRARILTMFHGMK